MARPVQVASRSKSRSTGRSGSACASARTANAKRQMLHEQRDCVCGCGGGWSERTARVELNNILARSEGRHMGAAEARARRSRSGSSKSRPSTSSPPTGCRRSSKASSARSRSARTPTPATCISLQTTCCRSSAATASTKSTKTFARVQDAQESKRRTSSRRRSMPARTSATRATASSSPRPCFDTRPLNLPRRDTRGGRRGRADLRQPRAQQTAEGPRPQAQAHLPRDGRAGLRRRRSGRARPLVWSASLSPRAKLQPGSTARAVAVRLSDGKRQKQIAAELGVAPGTVHFHVRNLGALRVGVYVGRKAILCTLGRSGVRNGELCDIRIGHLRLHDPEAPASDIPDSKTETGIRVVEVSPYLAEVLIMHIDRLRAPAATPAPRHTSSRTNAAPPHDPQARRDNRPRGRRARQREDARLGLPPLRTSPRTASGVPTSRSRCSPTNSTSSGSWIRSGTPTPR